MRALRYNVEREVTRIDSTPLDIADSFTHDVADNWDSRSLGDSSSSR